MTVEVNLRFENELFEYTSNLAKENGYLNVEEFLQSFLKKQMFFEDSEFLKERFLKVNQEIKENKLHSHEKIKEILLH